MLKRLTSGLLFGGLALVLTPTAALAAPGSGAGHYRPTDYGGDSHYRCMYHCAERGYGEHHDAPAHHGPDHHHGWDHHDGGDHHDGDCAYQGRYDWYHWHCGSERHAERSSWWGSNHDGAWDGHGDGGYGGYDSHRQHESP